MFHIRNSPHLDPVVVKGRFRREGRSVRGRGGGRGPAHQVRHLERRAAAVAQERARRLWLARGMAMAAALQRGAGRRRAAQGLPAGARLLGLLGAAGAGARFAAR